MPQTTVTASSGRMSANDAYAALATIKAVAGTFGGNTDAQNIHNAAHILQDAIYGQDLNPGILPSKAAVLSLQTALNTLVTERLLRSERATPDVHPATVVVLYGSEANDTARAFQVAAQALSCPPEALALTDVSPVQTDRVTGARWTIRVKMPHEK